MRLLAAIFLGSSPEFVDLLLSNYLRVTGPGPKVRFRKILRSLF